MDRPYIISPMPNAPREISVSIPEPILGYLELRFYDPATGRLRYGARSRLIVNLLERWIMDDRNRATAQTQQPKP